MRLITTVLEENSILSVGSIDIIWTNRSILFSSPEKNLVPILGALEICANPSAATF
jgi:hypothetical protein